MAGGRRGPRAEPGRAGLLNITTYIVRCGYIRCFSTKSKISYLTQHKPCSSLSPIMSLDSDMERVLWTQSQISDRVAQLASQINLDFAASHSPPLIVGVATGAFIFLADLIRNIRLPVSIDLVRAESYSAGTVSNGSPVLTLDLKLSVKGKHVILVLFWSTASSILPVYLYFIL